LVSRLTTVIVLVRLINEGRDMCAGNISAGCDDTVCRLVKGQTRSFTPPIRTNFHITHSALLSFLLQHFNEIDLDVTSDFKVIN
jgi:hypothetical protein